jgi:hypothetical protein
MARTPSGEIELRDPENLPRDERVFVVTAIGMAEIDAWLRGRGRAYRRLDFGPLALFEIEPVGAPAR